MSLIADRVRLAALQDEHLKRCVQQSLRRFVEWAWPILEPATPFLPNWHLDLLCEYLEEVTAGRITHLVINVPPRYMKSILVSILWPCWEWLRDPSMRYMFVSYSEALAARHAVDRRRVIRSDPYQRYWGSLVQLAPDQRTKLELLNTRRGAMVATSVGGSVTGKGGNRLILDDPHNPMQAESDTQRQQAIDFFTGTLSTRLDDKRRGAIVVVGQRLHQRDLSAVCLEQGFAAVILPAEAETRAPILFPRSGRVVTREIDEPLWPAREGSAELAAQKVLLGTYHFAGQYQQRPSPRGGGRFQRDWWRYYDDLPPCDRYAQSWDLAFKDGQTSDYVVGLVAGQQGANIYLIDRYKQRASFQQTCKAIEGMRAAYPLTQAIFIEDTANGPAVIDVLKQHVPGIIAVRPAGGKESRAAACEPRVQAGNIYLPRPTAPGGTPIAGRAWVHDFIEQFAVFPRGAHDDDVDAFSQLLVQWAHSSSSAYTDLVNLAHRMHDENWGKAWNQGGPVIDLARLARSFGR
jgi:predicted phage terminase large subunit-like protein